MHKENRRLMINAVASIIQTVIIGIVYFFLYKYVLRLLGADRLGLWSLIVASTSVGNIANLGMTGGIVKFVSAAQANRNSTKSADIVFTSLSFVGIFMLMISLILFGVFYYYIGLVVPVRFLAEARMILPYAILSLFLNSISAIFLSALDGLELIYIRSTIYSVTTIALLLLTYLIVPQYHLMGLVYAQTIQSILVLVLSIVLLYVKLENFSLLRFRFNKTVFKELFRYGLNFQVISIADLLFDPITKFFLGSYGGLAIVGYYEMANKLISQVRSLVVSANQAVVPFIARKNETGDKNITTYYVRMFKIMTLNTVLIFSALMIYSPLISYLWIGHIEKIFVYAVLILSIGWVFNIISVPAYFVNMGTGRLKWNVVAHLSLGIVNLILGFVLGKWLGGFFVMIGTGISLVISSAILLIKFHKENNIDIGKLVDERERFFISYLVAFVLISFISYSFFSNHSGYMFYFILPSVALIWISFWGFTKIKALADLYILAPKLLFQRE